jgi:hypothetical protein
LLYERTAADLAKITTFSSEPETRRYLESLVARAYGEIHETRERNRRINPLKWFFETLPQTFRRHIRAFWMSVAITLAGCAFGGFGGESRLGGVLVRRGDYVAADENGVVVFPYERTAEVMETARRCFEREEQIKRWIGAGMDPVEAHQRALYERPEGEKER